jgi:hypothetical protein
MLCTRASEEGGDCEGREECGLRRAISAVIHTEIRQSRGLGQTLLVWVAINDASVYMRERGGGRRGGCGLSTHLDTVSFADLGRLRVEFMTCVGGLVSAE